MREKISGPGRDFRPGPGKNLARPGIRARAGLRAENRRAQKTRAENCRAVKTRAAKSPGRAARPGADPWF